MYRVLYGFVGVVLLVWSACSKSAYPSVPTLTYTSVSPSTEVYKNNLILSYRVEDKEGDIDDTITIIKMYKNSKTKPLILKFKMPTIASTSDLSAKVNVLLDYFTDIGDPQAAYKNDTVIYAAFLKDAQNHISDTAFSEKIIIHF